MAIKIEAAQRLGTSVVAAITKESFTKKVDAAIEKLKKDGSLSEDIASFGRFAVEKAGKNSYNLVFSGDGYDDLLEPFAGNLLDGKTLAIKSGIDAFEKYTKWCQGIREKALAKLEKKLQDFFQV